LGTIRIADSGESTSLKRRLLTFAAILGPGLIVMVGDNDAGGVSTYSQAGQNYGYSLLWVLLLLIPVLIVNQEMVVRLGAVTGVGHARLINERFGKGWGWFSVGDLFVLNFLTIATAFIAVTLVQIPMLLLSHPSRGSAANHFVVPGIQGGISSNAVLLIIAIVGTTVAPWQLFFQQSNIIDKRI